MLQAYISLIANAQHYVYIENQFFVSIIDSADVRNEICKVLCERIKRAYWSVIGIAWSTFFSFKLKFNFKSNNFQFY